MRILAFLGAWPRVLKGPSAFPTRRPGWNGQRNGPASVSAAIATATCVRTARDNFPPTLRAQPTSTERCNIGPCFPPDRGCTWATVPVAFRRPPPPAVAAVLHHRTICFCRAADPVGRYLARQLLPLPPPPPAAGPQQQRGDGVGARDFVILVVIVRIGRHHQRQQQLSDPSVH